MKFRITHMMADQPNVAPCAGAGIEIDNLIFPKKEGRVAPCAGAGIEMQNHIRINREIRSPPARGRGLKSG